MIGHTDIFLMTIFQVLIDYISEQHDSLAGQKNDIDMNLHIFYETLQRYKDKAKLDAEFVR